MFRKHLLYLTNDHLSAYTWDRGKLSPLTRFENDADGREAFTRFAAASVRTPLYLLADLIEEDFVRETIPHAMGKTRRGLLERKLNQHYRESAYRLATGQGREKDGRRDDLMLFSALTNSDWVNSWVSILVKAKAPLAGVYSPALVCGPMIKKAKLTQDHLLVVSVQSCGLRQNYFQGEHLKFSRLTPLPGLTPEDIARSISDESRKIEQFLGTSRLLPRGKTMHVVVIDDGSNLPAMPGICTDTPSLSFRFMGTAEIAKATGLKELGKGPCCDPLYLSLLAHKAPAVSYIPKDHARYHLLWSTRIGLYGASGAVLAGGLLWAANNILDSMDFDGQRSNTQRATQNLQQQYDALIRQFPKTPTTPENMKAAVQIQQTIARNAAMPDAILSKISDALRNTPRIQITALHWSVAPLAATPLDNNAAPPATTNPDGSAPPIGADMLGIPAKPAQYIQIEGEIRPFQLDYRATLDVLKQFSTELEKDKSITTSLDSPPIDIRPVANITGNTDPSKAKAVFAMKIVWKPSP